MSSDYPRLLPICSRKGIEIYAKAINCDKAIESNANLRVERPLLFNEAVGACLDSRNSELTLKEVTVTSRLGKVTYERAY